MERDTVVRALPGFERAFRKARGEVSASRAATEPRSSLMTVTHVIYALHAVSLITGIVGAATVVGAFLTGWPSIIAVILNYVKRERGRAGPGSSRTSAGRSARSGSACCGCRSACCFVVATLGIGLLIAWLPLGVVGIWFIYRIVRGWLRLIDRQPMYH